MSDMVQNEVVRYANFVGDDDRSGAGGDEFESINPTSGALWGRFLKSTSEDVDRAIRVAHAAYETTWSRLTPTRRGRLLMRWGDKLAENAERIGIMETQQNGKLLNEMRAQAVAVREWAYYFGGLADKVEGQVIPLDRPSMLNYTLREPLGVVGVIVPWNSPTFLTMMAVCPALAAGNTVVIKPSEVTSASAFELAKLAVEAGIPPGVINVVTGLRETGEALVSHPLVRKVNFTGSDIAGRAIAAKAGSRLIETVQELGGKSANIIFDDVDLDQAEAGILSGIFAAAGQTCVAGSRVYIQKKIYDKLVSRLVERAGKIVIGNPLDANTEMGPVATVGQLKKNVAMVGQAVADGGRVLFGGARLSLPAYPNGYFFQPTVLDHCGPDNSLTRNEVFGPVMTVTPFNDEDEVVAAANDSEFGLAAGLWTNSIKRAHLVARRLQAGTVWINTYRVMAFNSPFGGYKSSGFGRQNGIEAIYQYLQTKSVWCDLGNEIRDPFIIKT